MPDYKALYEQLFGTMTDVIETLRKAQIETADTCSDEMKKERSKKITKTENPHTKVCGFSTL